MHQDWAETTVWSYLDRLFQAPELVQRIVEEASKKTQRAESEAKACLDAIRAEAALLEGKQRKWMERFEESDDDASSDVLWKRIKELEARRVALGEEAKALEVRLAGATPRQLSPEDVSRALSKLQGFAAAEPEKRRVLVERLVHRHDLRVRVLDGHRLAVSLRLDPTPDDAGTGAVGSRIVLTGQEPRRNAASGTNGRARPVYPRAPKPGDIGRVGGGGPTGVYHEEIVAVRFPRAETTEAWIERMNRSGAAPQTATSATPP